MRTTARIIIYTFSALLVSCGQEEDINENDFQFNLNNSYRIENTRCTYETPNGFGRKNTSEFTVFISDGKIEDELTAPCCNSRWNYDVNPTTKIQIYLKKSNNKLKSGRYKYTKGSDANDFIISVHNEMIFSNDNTLTSLSKVATTQALQNELLIENAQIELLLGHMVVQLHYNIETVDKKRIVGSYTGSLKEFNYNSCYADCD